MLTTPAFQYSLSTGLLVMLLKTEENYRRERGLKETPMACSWFGLNNHRILHLDLINNYLI